MLARLTRWFSPASPPPAVTAPEEKPKPLRRILLALGRRPGQGEPARLMVDSASCEVWHFSSQAALLEGDELVLQALLCGGESVTLCARVAAVRLTSKGLFGELHLRPDARARSILQDFLAREAA